MGVELLGGGCWIKGDIQPTLALVEVELGNIERVRLYLVI